MTHPRGLLPLSGKQRPTSPHRSPWHSLLSRCESGGQQGQSAQLYNSGGPTLPCCSSDSLRATLEGYTVNPPIISGRNSATWGFSSCLLCFLHNAESKEARFPRTSVPEEESGNGIQPRFAIDNFTSFHPCPCGTGE